MNNLNEKELVLLEKMLTLAVKNGNSVTKFALDPTPEEYRTLYDIRKKLGLDSCA